MSHLSAHFWFFLWFIFNTSTPTLSSFYLHCLFSCSFRTAFLTHSYHFIMVNMNSVLKQMIEALNAPFVYSVTIQVYVVHLFACTLTCTIFLTLFSFTHFVYEVHL